MIPARYLDTIGPLDGIGSMLELGNKNGTGGKGDSYKAHFEALGIRHVSVDWNGEDGALKLDLRQPLQLGGFDMVTNIGTSEHVDDQAAVWCNMLDAAITALVCITPVPGDWPGHGLFYPSDRFYSDLAELNGFEVEKLTIEGDPGRRLMHFRGRRHRLGPAILPDMRFISPAPPRRPKR